MLSFVSDAVRSRFGKALIFVILAYFIGAPYTAGPIPSEVANLIAMALCGAVGIVYAPDFFVALRTKTPTQGDWLGAGICIGWLSSAALKADGEAIAFGYVNVLTSTHHGFLILLQIIGAMCHLIAPQAQPERVKRQASVVVGITIGVSCALGVALFEARSFNVLAPVPGPHDFSAPRR